MTLRLHKLRNTNGWLRLAAVGLILVGAAFRLHGLDDQSIWLDEAFSVWIARHPLLELLGWLIRIDQHPPLYYILLRGWMTAFGDSPTSLRLLSVFFSIATLPLIHHLARRITGSSIAALTALAFLAVSPFHVRYAQEARMYALLTFAATFTFILAYAWLDSARTENRSLRILFAMIACEAAVMWTHNVAAVFVPLALNGAVLALWLHRGGGIAVRQWIAGQILALLLWLPWSFAFVQQAVGIDRRFWLQPPTAGDLWAALQSVNFAYLPSDFPAYPWIMLLFSLLAVAGVVHLRTRPTASRLLVAWLAFPVIGLLLVSLRRPLFHPPSLLWVSVPYLLLLSAGVAGWRQWRGRYPSVRRLWMLWATLFVGLNVVGVWHYFAYSEKEDWRGAAAFMAQIVDPGDLLLFHASWVQIPFDYYDEFVDPGSDAHGLPVDLFDRGELEPPMTAADLPRLLQLIEGRSRVWLIYSHDWFTDPGGMIPEALGEEMNLTGEYNFTGIRILRYERDSTDSHSTQSH